MVTYVVFAVAVALLAGLTGGMPAPALRPRRASPAGDAAIDDNALGALRKFDDVEPSLPSEILDALAKANCHTEPGQPIDEVCERAGGYLSVPVMQQPASPEVADPNVPAGAPRELLDEIVDSLMQGTQFLVLTGVRGAGKTVMAAAVRQELVSRSVNVRCVVGGGDSGITLRAIMSGVLGKPESDVDADDIERLFDAMTDRETADERLALIIDDAERLLPDAIGYLRLLASIAMQRMPQIVFVGDPSFWDVAARTAGFNELITARFELERPSQAETCVAAEQHGLALEQEVAEDVVKHRSGVVARLVSLVAGIQAIAANTRANDASDALHPVLPSRGRRIARMAGVAAVVVGAVAVPSHRSIPSAERISTDVQNSVDTAIMMVRLPPSAQPVTKVSDSGSSNIWLALASELPVLPARIGPAVARRKPVAKAKITQEPPQLTGYPTGSTTGTWLFQANQNNGANS